MDILVNNAGITIGGQFVADMALADWHRVLDVNLNSVLYMCKAALPLMRARGGGSVVNIASNVVNTLPGGAAAYATTKAGVVALTKVLSKEEAEHGIRVNVVSPGIIDRGAGARGAGAADVGGARAVSQYHPQCAEPVAPKKSPRPWFFGLASGQLRDRAAPKRQRRRPHRILPVEQFLPICDRHPY